jgi:uncharacterized protein (DUF3820 family)
MTADQFTDLLTELRAIRAALESKPAQPRSGTAHTGATFDAPVPMPEVEIDLPGAVEVPFGKNKGQRLDDLPANSLRWYALSWELREKQTGGFWPGDIKLRNAARQLWHAKHASGKTATASGSKPAAATQSTNLDESVPF